jgi:hypothetical protein
MRCPVAFARLLDRFTRAANQVHVASTGGRQTREGRKHLAAAAKQCAAIHSFSSVTREGATPAPAHTLAASTSMHSPTAAECRTCSCSVANPEAGSRNAIVSRGRTDYSCGDWSVYIVWQDDMRRCCALGQLCTREIAIVAAQNQSRLSRIARVIFRRLRHPKRAFGARGRQTPGLATRDVCP